MPDDKKHFDVAKAGQLPVSHTSRPVIVDQSQPVANDPMMKPGADSKPSESLAPEHKLKLQPIHSDTAPESDTKAAEEKPDQAAGTDVENRLPANDNPAIQKLIDDKTYHLPIKSSATKSLRTVGGLLVLIILVVAGVAYFIMNR